MPEKYNLFIQATWLLPKSSHIKSKPVHRNVAEVSSAVLSAIQLHFSVSTLTMGLSPRLLLSEIIHIKQRISLHCKLNSLTTWWAECRVRSSHSPYRPASSAQSSPSRTPTPASHNPWLHWRTAPTYVGTTSNKSRLADRRTYNPPPWRCKPYATCSPSMSWLLSL